MSNIIVDLHVHSHYAYATSPAMNLESLYRWGKIKGIDVIGTGDFTHPKYFAEIEKLLQPAEDGLFMLRPKLATKQEQTVPEILRTKTIRFMLTVEISCIYQRHNQLRKVHNVIVVSSIGAARKLNAWLATKGNLSADGRPTFSLDSEEVLKKVFAIDDKALFIPAHIWTPWFGLFGSKSGFNSMAEAFGDSAKYISALETGLSSDPPMNWRWSELDSYTMVSHSDAHSPQKLGREANVLNTRLSYQDITEAIKTGDNRFVGTIEFFPQEGKYHHDGHRKCKVCLTPSETRQADGLCQICGKPVTVGVLSRVEDLANRAASSKRKKQVEYIIPLTEILAELKNVKSTKTKSVQSLYDEILKVLGNEFSILRDLSLKKLKSQGFFELAEAISRMRQGKIQTKPGYDGEYGLISHGVKMGALNSQQGLFDS